MTFRSRVVERRIPRGVLLVFLASLSACSDVAEWQRRESSLELYVDPLPLAAGEAFWVEVRGSNVGPVDVLQGDERVATFLGLDLSDGVVRQAMALSDEVPEAVAVGYDFREVRVAARPFEDDVEPPPLEPDPAPEEPVESCPGAVDADAPACLAPEGTETLTIRVHNRTAHRLNVVEYVPIGLNADQCVPGTVALVPPSDVRTAEVTGGAMVGVLVDGTAQVLRAIVMPDALPDDGSCELVIEP